MRKQNRVKESAWLYEAEGRLYLGTWRVHKISGANRSLREKRSFVVSGHFKAVWRSWNFQSSTHRNQK
jgi:hypothetical protein